MGRNGVRDNPVRRLRVLFLVRALSVGGAETQLVAAAIGLKRLGHDVQIAVFYAVESPLAREAAEGGVCIVDLAKRGRWDAVGFIRRLRAVIVRHRADVVYSYLPSANVVSALASLLLRKVAVVWGIRATQLSGASDDWLGHMVAGCERMLARRADAIIVNSARGIEHHARRGLPRGVMRLVRNGVDAGRFRFDARARMRLRSQAGISDTDPLVLLAGRHDPIKGIETFLRACQALPVRAIIVGGWIEPYTSTLRRLATSLGMVDRVQWLDQQDDMSGWMSAADIVCSASYGEGTSNVLIEALACNALTVATDVGDSADIVGDPARMAAPRDCEGLIRALQTAIAMLPEWNRHALPPEQLDNYSIAAMLAATESVLAAVAAERAGI
jgi:glycosyltransferase involved in cell wall biosynthesis